MSDGSLVRTLPHEISHVDSVAISPDGSQIVTASHTGVTKIWNTSDGSLIIILPRQEFWTLSVAISTDGSKVVMGSGKTAKIWHLLPVQFETLKNLNLKQVRLLEWLHELAVKGKKADFADATPANAPYIEQYALLPDLIKDMVKGYIKFE